MFSGIVEELGVATRAEPGRLELEAAFGASLGGGDSVAVNGVCLTVAQPTDTGFSADVMPETLRRTTLGSLRPGSPVNLERSLAVGGRIGGHLVTGHVDSTGTVTSVRDEANARLVAITLPQELLPMVAPKGSIAVDGISLTVVDVLDGHFTVSLVPHTLEHTTAGRWAPGSEVNLEVDVLARYVRRMLDPAPAEAG